MAACGNCTLCCTLFPVKWLDKPHNTPCVHCDAGCSIHDTKPAECSDFNCAYSQMEQVSIGLRPDNCGIIFEKLSADLFYGTIAPGIEISAIAKEQIQAFLAQGFSVVLSSLKEKDNLFIVNKDHDEQAIRSQFGDMVHGYLQH